MILRDSHFRKFRETEKFILGHVYECAYLISKKGGKKIYVGDFYGDPYCGLIDLNNKWCLVGGNVLCGWTEDRGVFEIKDEKLSWICRMKQISAFDAELLIDPRSDNGAIWALNIKTLENYKIKEYKLDGEYSEDIDW